MCWAACTWSLRPAFNVLVGEPIHGKAAVTLVRIRELSRVLSAHQTGSLLDNDLIATLLFRVGRKKIKTFHSVSKVVAYYLRHIYIYFLSVRNIEKVMKISFAWFRTDTRDCGRECIFFFFKKVRFLSIDFFVRREGRRKTPKKTCSCIRIRAASFASVLAAPTVSGSSNSGYQIWNFFGRTPLSYLLSRLVRPCRPTCLIQSRCGITAPGLRWYFSGCCPSLDRVLFSCRVGEKERAGKQQQQQQK